MFFNTFAASYLNTQGLNNSCLKSPASTLVDAGNFKHELLNRLRSTMAVNVLKVSINMRNQVFSGVTVCRWVSNSQYCEGIWYLHLQGSTIPRRLLYV